MVLTNAQRQLILDFRRRIEAQAAAGTFAGESQRYDREDELMLITRWPVGEHVWYEFTVRPFLPQVRVALRMDERWKSEEFEQTIRESGDTMSEFVAAGFETAGLHWPSPPVEHYRENGKYFYFATPLELEHIDEVGDEAVGVKVSRMLQGYRNAFGGAE